MKKFYLLFALLLGALTANAADWYLCGGFNGWADVNTDKFTKVADNVWELRKSGAYIGTNEFKVKSGNTWLGNGSTISVGSSATISSGNNMKIKNASNYSEIVFQLQETTVDNTKSYTLHVFEDKKISGNTLYLIPAEKWKEARFAIYVYGGALNTWESMTLVEGETNIYEVTVPDGAWTNMIFCRMNPNTTTNNWGSKWNQTKDLTYDGIHNLCTVAVNSENDWDVNTSTTWSIYYPSTLSVVMGETTVELEATASEGIFTGSFDTGNATSFVLVGGGKTYGAAAENIELESGDYVVEEGTTEWIVKTGMLYTITVDLTTGILSVQDVVTGIDEVGVDAGEAVYYNLQGVKVANPGNGIFIKKQAGKTTKVIL